MKVFLVIDNRFVTGESFQIEAATSSFYKLFIDLVGKYELLCFQHDWLPYPEGIVFSASPESTMVLPVANPRVTATFDQHYKLQEQLRIQQDRLRPHYSSIGGNLSANITWKLYLCDALQKIKLILANDNSIKKATDRAKNDYDESSKDEKVVIFIYSSDLLLFGNSATAPIHQGLNIFLQTYDDIRQMFSLEALEIRIVSAMTGDSKTCLNDNALSLQRELLNPKNRHVEFEPILISTVSFDQELRTLLGRSVPKLTCTLALPGTEEFSCSLTIEMIPHTLQSADCMKHIKQIDSVSLCSRDDINPLYLGGYGIEITAPLHPCTGTNLTSIKT